MMGIEHAYWSRCSNEKILERAHKILSGWDDITKDCENNIRPNNEIGESKIRMVSEILRDKRQKLLMHIMRSNEEDPLYQVTFDNRGNSETYFKQFEKKRVGRPRGHWTETTMGEMMKDYYETEFERENENHYIMLFSIALDRLG